LTLGYEYNFDDPAINLVLGSSHWKKFLDQVQEQVHQSLQFCLSIFASSLFALDSLVDSPSG
jgi:hypothetical protein